MNVLFWSGSQVKPVILAAVGGASAGATLGTVATILGGFAAVAGVLAATISTRRSQRREVAAQQRQAALDLQAAKDRAFAEGRAEGYDDGQRVGYEAGKRDGIDEGRRSADFQVQLAQSERNAAVQRAADLEKERDRSQAERDATNARADALAARLDRRDNL